MDTLSILDLITNCSIMFFTNVTISLLLFARSSITNTNYN